MNKKLYDTLSGRIGSCAFMNCTKITSVNLPDTVITIGNNAFYSLD